MGSPYVTSSTTCTAGSASNWIPRLDSRARENQTAREVRWLRWPGKPQFCVKRKQFLKSHLWDFVLRLGITAPIWRTHHPAYWDTLVTVLHLEKLSRPKQNNQSSSFSSSTAAGFSPFELLKTWWREMQKENLGGNEVWIWKRWLFSQPRESLVPLLGLLKRLRTN